MASLRLFSLALLLTAAFAQDLIEDIAPRPQMSCYVDKITQTLPLTNVVTTGQLRILNLPLEAGCLMTSPALPEQKSTIAPDPSGMMTIPSTGFSTPITVHMYASQDCPNDDISQCTCMGYLKRQKCFPTNLPPPGPMTVEEQAASSLLASQAAQKEVASSAVEQAQLIAQAAVNAAKDAKAKALQSASQLHKAVADLELSDRVATNDLEVSDRKMHNHLRALAAASIEDLSERIHRAALRSTEDVDVTPWEEIVQAKVNDLQEKKKAAAAKTVDDTEEGDKVRQQMIPRDSLGSSKPLNKELNAAENKEDAKTDLNHFFGAGDFAKNDKVQTPPVVGEEEERTPSNVLRSFSSESDDDLQESKQAGPVVDLESSWMREQDAIADIELAVEQLKQVEPQIDEKIVYNVHAAHDMGVAFVRDFVADAEASLMATANTHAAAAAAAEVTKTAAPHVAAKQTEKTKKQRQQARVAPKRFIKPQVDLDLFATNDLETFIEDSEDLVSQQQEQQGSRRARMVKISSLDDLLIADVDEAAAQFDLDVNSEEGINSLIGRA